MAVEMSLFAVAIGITLVARLLGQGCWKDALTHASSFLTLGSLVVLPPYFWHQRTYISTDGVLDDAFHKRARGVVKNNIEDVLLGAARRGDYVLFRDGVDRLAKDAEYLPYLRQMKKSLEGDVYALEIVTAGLRQLGDPDEQAPDGVPGIQ
jgi:hypothetical protein